MPYRLKSAGDHNFVLEKTSNAKVALGLFADYCLIDAYNLSLLSKGVYESDLLFVRKSLEKLHIDSAGGASKKTGSGIPAIPMYYPGKQKYFCSNYVPIKSSGHLSIDTQGFHYNDDQYNVLAFRGTEFPYPRDLITCLKAPKVEYPHASGAGKVHQGFLDAFDSIKTIIEQIFEDPENKSRPTILAGHSLGGALAQLAAAFIAEKYQDHPCGKAMVYTYGSPRVGDAHWVRYFSQVRPFTHFRHRHLNDIIPLLPPQRLDMKYTALGVSAASTSAYGLAGGLLVFCLGNSSSSRDAFVHHGEEIVLRKGAGEKIYLALGDSISEAAAVNAGGILGDSKMLLNELVNTAKNLGGFGDHGMKLYCDALFACLKDAVVTWKKDPKTLRERAEGMSKAYAAEISHWEKELLKPVPTALRDATATSSAGRQVSESERRMQIERILAACRDGKMKADIRISIWSTPNANENAIRLIWPGDVTEYLEEELGSLLS